MSEFTQLEIIFPDANKPKAEKPILRNLKKGTTFSILGHGESYYIKVSPISFLLNSTLVKEVLERGDCFAVNLTTQNVCILPGNREVEPVAATLSISKKS